MGIQITESGASMDMDCPCSTFIDLLGISVFVLLYTAVLGSGNGTDNILFVHPYTRTWLLSCTDIQITESGASMDMDCPCSTFIDLLGISVFVLLYTAVLGSGNGTDNILFVHPYTRTWLLSCTDLLRSTCPKCNKVRNPAV